MLNLIPKERRASFRRALTETFGRPSLQEVIELFAGGSLSRIYRLVINDKPYVLRLMTLEEHLEIRKNQITCQEIAARLGIAPHLYYANADLAVLIMDYIETEMVQIDEAWLKETAGMLLHLHSYEDFFPESQTPLFSYMQEIMEQVSAQSTSPFLFNYFKQCTEVMTALRPHLIKRPCHNDLNKHNLLFHGKTYFIDWEAAGQEDPFFDLASLCNEFIDLPSLETYFLKEYFGKNPNDVQKAKLLLMKQISYCYLASHYFIHAINGGLRLDEASIQEARTTLGVWIENYLVNTKELSGPLDYLNYGLMQITTSAEQMKTAIFDCAKKNLRSKIDRTASYD